MKKIGRAKLSVEFDSPMAANSIIDSPLLKDKNLVASIFSFRVLRQGIVKDIALDFNVEDLLKEAESPAKIISAQRLNRRVRDGAGGSSKFTLTPSKTILIKFEGQSLPSSISLFKIRLPVLPFIPRIQIPWN